MRDQDAKIFLNRAFVEIVIYVNIKYASAISASSMNSLSEPNQDALLSNLYVKTEKYFFLLINICNFFSSRIRQVWING